MAYEFSFDGKSLWALGVGSAALCLLLFFGGVLLGANWGAREAAQPDARAANGAARPPAPPAPPATGAPGAAATTAADASVAALPYAPPPPPAPAVYDLPGPQDYAAREYAPQWGGAPQGYDAQGYAAQGYAAQQGAGAPAPAWADAGAQQRRAAPAATGGVAERDLAAVVSREAARLSGAGADADPRLVSEAEDAAPAQPAQTPAGYAVQVGAYADEGEAKRLLGELENKGYTPTMYRGRDAGGRPWYAVRVGAYASQREASQAAENFYRQERVKAAVRPSNSL
ncbi:MAG TPA: SPOR domain-containing protein [Pyrinomonadaceae bacterium]|jgi:cell division septation protein DedD